MADKRITDFATLAEAQDDDLLLVASEDETYNITVKTFKTSLKLPRNYVRGFKHATATFNIDTVNQKVEFAPTSAALIWGDNGYRNITKGLYAVMYSEMTKPVIVDLVYSTDTKMFSFVATATADIAASDYVIMTLYINANGAINHIVACDDILDRITITDANGTTEYYSTHSLKAEVVAARTAYDGTVHASLRDSLNAQFNKFAQRYRNYARDYNGNISVDITTDSENGLIHITVTPKRTSVIFCDAASYRLEKDTDGHNTLLPLSAYGVYHIMWSSTYGLITADYKAASITEDDIILFTIYIDGFNNVGNIIACDAMLNSIYVNNEKWIAEAVEKETEIPYNQNTCAIFQRVVCIGDSATAGHIDYGYDANGELSTSVKIRRNEAFAWPAFMAKLTGNEYVNLGISGATAETWLDRAVFDETNKTLTVTDSQTPFTETVTDTDKVHAYLIGLGLNDSALFDVETETPNLLIGSVDNIGTSANTFYGKYSQIIENIHRVSPKAKIFVQTMIDTTLNRDNYNAAIKEIAEAYENVHVLDWHAYKDLYEVNTIVNDHIGGHWTAISYQQFAEILRHIWSEYINGHISDFQDIHLI